MKALPRLWLLFSLCGLLAAQPSRPHFARVYAGKDGLAHVVDGTGKDITIAKEPQQASVDVMSISTDGQFAGWEVFQENCCTSYPIPTSVAIHSAKGHHMVGDGLMIYDWCFVRGKSQVAVSSGTVHGWTSGSNLHLYSAVSGKVLSSWLGEPPTEWPGGKVLELASHDPPAKPPDWSSCLKQ